jgi:hypothetical protein
LLTGLAAAALVFTLKCFQKVCQRIFLIHTKDQDYYLKALFFDSYKALG